MLSLALLATLVAKMLGAKEMAGGGAVVIFFWSVFADLFVYMGLTAIFAWLESISRWFGLLTIPLSFVVTLFALANASFLILAGEQGSYESLLDLYKRHNEALMVMEELFEAPGKIALVGGGVLGMVLLPTVIHFLLKRFAQKREKRGSGRLRAHCALSIALLAGVGSLAFPRPRSVEARKLGSNAAATTLRTVFTRYQAGSFKGWGPDLVVEESEIARFAGGERPNVLLLFLESTRYDYTSLSGEESPAETPNLLALAERGLVAHRARAVLPHTTKSMFSMVCGRFPTMQKGVIEVSGDNDIQCLADILRAAGYDTAFFQSAFGTFEQRPRLVRQFGFEHFKAWEDIQGQKLGYLASADSSLREPVLKWLDGRKQKDSAPFFATILTSATHHPYRLSRELIEKAKAEKLPWGTGADRYARLIEGEDALLGDLIAGLKERGLLDNTLIIAVGDHGEGFGGHGVRQHDNNLYEEGLRVPFVIAGPGVPHADLHENVSLVDLTPTVLGRLGVSLREDNGLEGYDILSEEFPGDSAPRWFGCFSDMRCRGYVLGDKKVIYEPQSADAWYFDLTEDADERNPIALTRELERQISALNHNIDRRRVNGWDMVYDKTYEYTPWRCGEGSKHCKHPKASNKRYRYKKGGKKKGKKGKKKKGAKKTETKATKRRPGTRPRPPKKQEE